MIQYVFPHSSAQWAIHESTPTVRPRRAPESHAALGRTPQPKKKHKDHSDQRNGGNPPLPSRGGPPRPLGKNKFIYDVFGDTVNVASRLAAASEDARVMVATPCLAEGSPPPG